MDCPTYLFRTNKLHNMPHTVNTHITNLSNEHSSWLRGIAFYRDEIRILFDRLNAFIGESTSTHFSTKMEEYRNKIGDLQNGLQSLEKDIQSNFDLIGNDLAKKEMYVSNSAMAQADWLRNEYIATEKSFNAFRHDFNRFLCDNLEISLK